jgi:hypothetical protein
MYQSHHITHEDSHLTSYELILILIPSFESDKEEAAYYRDKYRVAVDLLNETRAELGT